MSGTADRLLKLIYEWIKEAEKCSSNLRGLAQDLESLREKCNAWETVGNTVAVVGSGVSIAAAFFTGGGSLFLAGMLTGLAGTGTSLVTKITELFKTSDKLEKVKEIDEKCNRITNQMQDLFKELKDQCPSKNENDRDEHAVQEFLKAISRHNKLDIHFKDLDEMMKGIMKNEEPNVAMKVLMATFVYETISLLGLFSLRVGGKVLSAALAVGRQQIGKAALRGAAQLEGKLISAAAAEGAKQIGKSVAVKGASRFLGGAVGLAFSLPDAINSWTEAIEGKHETDASKQLRNVAEKVEKSVKDLSQKLKDILKNLKDTIEIHRSQKAGVTKQSKSAKNLDLNTSKSHQKNNTNKQQQHNSQRSQTSHNRGGSSAASDPPDRQDDDEEDKRGRKWCIDSDSDTESSSDTEREFESSSEVEEVLNMAMVNARSLNTFLDERNPTHSPETIVNLLQRNNIDVFLVTETWLRTEMQIQAVRHILPRNYNIVNVPRPSEYGTRGGGVAIIYRNNLEIEPILFDLNITSFEYVATAITRPNAREPVLILNIYRRPGGNVDTFTRNFLREFRSLMSQAYERFRNVILGGDFNVWVDRIRNHRAIRFQENTREHNLVQHVSQSTHRNGHTLDLILTRQNVTITIVSIEPNNFSDHFTIIFIANLRLRRRRRR